MPAFKNYGCESSESCSLMSVTGLSSNSEIKSTCSIESNSSSCDKLESSSCAESTYCDKSSCSVVSEKSFSPCNQSLGNDKCLTIAPSECSRLVKKYNCSREELLAISDIIIVLNFIKSKLQAVQPNVVIRNCSNYAIEANIEWLESFVDTLFCVLRKNEAYKVIKVKECKLLNDPEFGISNRTYIIEIKYNTKCGEKCNKIPLTFKWSQLTNNTSKSYNGVLNDTINSNIDPEIKAYQAKSTIPFLH
jgi:hypothetical protein